MTSALLIAALLLMLFSLTLQIKPLRKWIENWFARTVPWIWSLMRGDVRRKYRPSFGDFLGIAGLIVTVVGIFIGVQSVKQDNARISLESQIQDLTQRNNDLQARVRRSAGQGDSNFAPNIDIHLQNPRQDSVLTGISEPDLQWRYAAHGDNVNYLVEVVKLDFRGKETPGSNTYQPGGEPCNFDIFRGCRFVATNPVAQRTQIPLSSSHNKKPGMTGEFLWRVVPDLGSSADRGQFYTFGDGRLSEWSEYGSFKIYPDLVSRVRSGSIIIGTTYSDNNRFSTINNVGKPQGFDIDLILLLVKGCLTPKKDSAGNEAVVYDPDACVAATVGYTKRKPPVCGEEVIPAQNPEGGLNPSGAKGVDVSIRAFPTVEDGLAAVRRKELDVFVGAVTRAAEREKEGLRFSTGYYTFRSRLYYHGQEAQRLQNWARNPQTIGVIANSTNHWLAAALSDDPSFGGRLTIVAFPTYWTLRNAFENREVAGLLIDSVMGDDLMSTKDVGGGAHQELTGLDKTSAWRDYYTRLGHSQEEFAIAVASDGRSRITKWDRFLDFFYLPGHGQGSSSTQDLYDPLQAALNSSAIQFALPYLKRLNCVGQSGESD